MSTVNRRRAARPAEEASPEVRRARARLAGGDARGALRLINEHLARHPDDAPALFERARILIELGERPAALESQLKALGIKKAATDAAAVAEMLVEDGLYAEAEALLVARLARDDGQFTTRFTLAKLLLFSNRFLEAGIEIKRLYQRSKKSPLVRADYLASLRFALLGDERNVRAERDRLLGNSVGAERLLFFDALLEIVSGGDPDHFAETMARLRRTMRGNPLYHSLFKMITPDRFLGVESRTRREFRRILGTRLKAPRLTGASFSEEETLVVEDLFMRSLAVRFREIDAPDAGFSGDRVLRAMVETKTWRENSCLLKLGPKYRIALEREKMETYVLGKLHPGHHPQILGYAHGLRHAGLRLSWATDDDAPPVSLRRLAADEETPIETLQAIVSDLFRNVLKGWHRKNAGLKSVLLFERIRKDLVPKLEAIVPPPAGDAPIFLPIIKAEFMHPAETLRRLEAARGKKKTPAFFGLHHGDLNTRNVLLDDRGGIRLIDFYKSGPGFVLLDFARLEADLRFECLNVETSYLEEIKWMNEQLARAESLAEIRAIDTRRSLTRRLDMALLIRSLAVEIFGLGERETLELHAVALLIVLTRLLGHGHLAPAVTELVLAEIDSLGERLLEGA